EQAPERSSRPRPSPGPQLLHARPVERRRPEPALAHGSTSPDRRVLHPAGWRGGGVRRSLRGSCRRAGKGSELMPQNAIVLGEFGSLEVALSKEECAALRSRYAKQIDMALTEQGDVYRLTARDYVGRVGLPGGRILVIQPKVAVANLFYMLCTQAGLAGFHP